MRAGTIGIALTPLELLEKLAVLVPLLRDLAAYHPPLHYDERQTGTDIAYTQRPGARRYVALAGAGHAPQDGLG
jgi:hypothetical protein